MIPQSFIQDLLHRVDIVDVVDRHVKLKRAGANYAACCPFHNEKTPSFTVSPSKQFYHCFGCGAHGTAIGFVMEYSGLGFVDAVKQLAQAAGMQVPDVRSEERQRRSEADGDLHAVLLKAAQFYRAQLREARHAIDYLRRRGLSGDIAKRFGVGYAPDGWQNLAAVFAEYGSKALIAAGLVKENEEGRRYDVFRSRIMFPIVDVRGNVIGFGGRVLEGGDAGSAAGVDPASRSAPKYLNSPETAIFEKGRELYGLYQARRAIREAGRVVVVEGYMDVVALAQHGIEYAVATLGTATTPLHVQKLLRQADEIVFCFDGDDAGRRAAWRALENSLAQLADGKQVRFLFLPQGEDPDTFVRAGGAGAFESLLSGTLPLSRFLLQELAQRCDLEAAEGRANFLHQAKPLLRQIKANALRMQIVREVGEMTRTAPDEVERLCELMPLARRTRPSEGRSPRPLPQPLPRRLLRILLGNPGLAEGITEEQRALLGPDAELAPVAALVDFLQSSKTVSLAGVFEAMRDSAHARVYAEAGAEILAGVGNDDSALADLNGAFAQLELRRVESEYAELSASGVSGEGERLRFKQISRRLAELKGVAGVIVRPPL
jgi:DNA primase